MSAKPSIQYVRPLVESPAIHEAVATTFSCAIDSDRANLIGADGREYVYVPADDEGFFFIEAVPAEDSTYSLQQVPADRARALFRASRDYQPGDPSSLPS